MKKLFKLAKGEVVNDVFYNGLRQSEGKKKDYFIKNSNIEFVIDPSTHTEIVIHKTQTIEIK